MAQVILRGIDQVVPVLAGKKYLLVCGHSFDRLPFSHLFTHCGKFQEFTPNPLYEQVVEGVKLFNRTGCDSIVAVGGGSAMDVAKCIKLFCRMDPAKNYLEQGKQDSGIPLIAVPTTGGTGSESTKHAVIYYEGSKQSISHDSILPDYAVLEPSVLEFLPLYQKKCTMLDAVCQAIESWWSVSSTEKSIRYSQKALELILSSWKEYLERNTWEARERILLGANYAGRAINLTATTAAHAMSYKLTSLYHIPHGHAVALCLPGVWQAMYTQRCTDARGQQYLMDTMRQIEERISLQEFRDLLQELQLKSPVSTDRDAELSLLTASVNPVRLKNNPVLLEETALRKIYEEIVR